MGVRGKGDPDAHCKSLIDTPSPVEKLAGMLWSKLPHPAHAPHLHPCRRGAERLDQSFLDWLSCFRNPLYTPNQSQDPSHEACL